MLKINSADRQILHLALPSILSNITGPLMGMVDLAIVGHMDDVAYIGAVGVGAMIFNVIYWIFGFLRMGTSGLTSQALGHRSLREVTALLLRSQLLGILIGLLFILLQVPLIDLGLLLMHPEPQVMAFCRTYCLIGIWGAPAMLALYGLTGWFVGMQNTRIPMVVSITQNIVNVALSLLFVIGLDMKIEGVALGTVLAQWTGMLLACALGWHYYGRLGFYADFRGLLRWDALRQFFLVNRDIFLRTLFLVAVNLFFTAAGARQGTLIVAVNTMLLTFFTLFSYFMDGFAYAGEALCGRHFGAGNARAFNDIVRRLFRWGGAMAILFSALYVIGGQALLSLLTASPEVLSTAADYYWWAVCIPLAGFAAFVYDALFVGITHTRGMLCSTALSALLFFILYFALCAVLHNHALWLAFIAYLALRGIVLHLIYMKWKVSMFPSR